MDLAERAGLLRDGWRALAVGGFEKVSASAGSDAFRRRQGEKSCCESLDQMVDGRVSSVTLFSEER